MHSNTWQKRCVYIKVWSNKTWAKNEEEERVAVIHFAGQPKLIGSA